MQKMKLIIITILSLCFAWGDQVGATVSSTTTKTAYTCNGTSTTYAYPFRILEDDDIKVIVSNSDGSTSSALALNTDYTVTGAGGLSGGNVVLTAGSKCASAKRLTLLRNIDLLQSTDYVDGDAFSADTLETPLDKCMLIDQQQNEALGRCPKLPESSPHSNYVLPTPTAGKLLGWGQTDATKIENYSATINTAEFDSTVVNTISDLRLLTPVANQTIQLLGYYAAGDTDMPLYRGVTGAAPGTYVDNGGSIIVPTGGDGSAAWLWVWSGAVNVKWFGAKGDNVFDDTTAIQAGANLLSSGGKLYIPKGIYKTTSTIFILFDRVHLVGDGIGSTMINFMPTGNAVCLQVGKNADVIYQGSISNVSFFSNNVTHTKTAIKLIDHSGWAIDNCGTTYPHIKGAGSVFLHILGREAGFIRNIYAEADRPILCEQIPLPHTANGIGLDHHNFHNIYIIAGNYPCVQFGSGLNVTQCSFTGVQAWVGGTHGFYWVDTTTSGVSNGLSFANVRFEQGIDQSSWLFFIQHNYALSGVEIIAGQGGDRNGIYMRKCENVTIANFCYTSTTGEALNVDATVKRVTALNCFWQAGTTAQITGQRNVYSVAKNPNTGALPPTFFYDEESNGDVDTHFGGRINANYGQIKFPAVRNGSADANTLDDYEKGVWTPVWVPASGSGQTVTTAVGWYVKIGPIVHVHFYLALNGLGSASGTILIDGLPFLSTGVANKYGGLNCSKADNLNIVAGQNIVFSINYNTTTFTPRIWGEISGTRQLVAAEWGPSGAVSGYGFYFTDN